MSESTYSTFAAMMKAAKIRRLRAVHIARLNLLIIFVRPKNKTKLAALMEQQAPKELSYAIASLGFWECIFKRRVYHFI